VYYVYSGRNDCLDFFPKGGVGCEVGVFQGAFSRQIVKRIAPRELHLVDAWRFTPERWGNTPGEIEAAARFFKEWLGKRLPQYDGGDPAPHLDAVHEAVAAGFVDRPQVKIHRAFSREAARAFPDRFFDFIYIDADLRYEQVLRDLFTYEKKLKDGGILFGDDFQDDLRAEPSPYGVIEAVTTFLKRTGYHCLAITGPLDSNFFLCKSLSPYVNHFIDNLLRSNAQIISINDCQLANYAQRAVTTSGGDFTRTIPSF